MEKEKKEFLKLKDVAELFGVTTPTIRNWQKKGVLEPDVILPSGRARYTREQIDAFVAAGGIKNKK